MFQLKKPKSQSQSQTQSQKRETQFRLRKKITLQRHSEKSILSSPSLHCTHLPTLAAFFLGINFLSSSSTFAVELCSEITEQKKPYCLALKTIEKKKSCLILPEGSQSRTLCEVLGDLEKRGSCPPRTNPEDAKGPQKICRKVLAGLLLKPCQSFRTIEDTNWCEFGTYIKNEHPHVALRIQKANIRNQSLKPKVEHWARSVYDAETAHSLESLVLNLASKLQLKFLAQLNPHSDSTEPLSPPSASAVVKDQDFVSFVGELILFVEKHRNHLQAIHQQNPSQVHYFPYGTPIEGETAPCALALTPQGRLLVFLKTVRIKDQTLHLEPLGTGTYKEIHLAFDYDDALSSESDLHAEHPFLAEGEFRIQIKSGEQSIEEQLAHWYQDSQQEFELHKMVSDKKGVTRTDALFMVTDEQSSPLPQIKIIQKLYEETLLDLYNSIFARNRHQAVTHYRGTSLKHLKVDIAVQLLEGLSSIHAAGIHHRDIKPENILIDYDQFGKPQARITDFGLSANLEWLKSGKQASNFAGSATYLAPFYVREFVAKNHRANLNIKNDIWAMGLTLNIFDNFFQWNKTGALETNTLLNVLLRLSSYKDLRELYTENLMFEPERGTFEHVIYRMVNPDPTQQPTADEALAEMKAVQARLRAEEPDPEFFLELTQRLGRFVFSPASPPKFGIKKNPLSSRVTNISLDSTGP